MKAIVCTRYGPPDVLHLEEVDKPVPKNDEVLIRVYATSVTAGDCELRGLKVSFAWQLLLRMGFGLRAPRKKILGQELAGKVESVGKDVKLFKKDDEVFANTGLLLGTYAEYCCLPEGAVMLTKPANMTYEEAATVPYGGLAAMPFVRRANIQRGQKVLIIGAGGSIGTISVQLTKALGAEVTGVDRTDKLGTLLSIGADHVVDYTKEDFTKSGETYDVIYDAAGKGSVAACVGSLKEKGIFLGGPGLSPLLRGLWTSMTSSKRVVIWTGTYRLEDLVYVKGLIEAGKIRSVIDRSYPLEHIVEAHRYVESGLKKGNVVIQITPIGGGGATPTEHQDSR